MLNWTMLKRDGRTGLELWQTPSRFLVCQKYCGYYVFIDNFDQAMQKYKDDKNEKEFH